MKKKIMAFILAATMALGMATTVFADETTTDTTSVQLKKTYTIENEGTISPAEDFEYTIEYVECTDSGYAADARIPVPYFSKDEEGNPVYTGKILFAEGEATIGGTTHETTIYLPEYEYVGIYTYKITEKIGNEAGVTYDTNLMYLKVTVVEENGKKRVVALHYDTESGNKTECFENKFSAADLSVSKFVTGNLGDQSKKFDFTVTFNVPEGKNVTGTITVKYANGSKMTFKDWANKTYNLELKHGDTVYFENIPDGVTYTVTEANYTGLNYDAPTFKLDGTSIEPVKTDTGYQVTGTILGDGEDESVNDAVEITNNKTAEVDTGINLDSMIYIAILAVAAVGLVGVVARKRTAR